jgi:tetratricopeptide (TPR) repeat protein
MMRAVMGRQSRLRKERTTSPQPPREPQAQQAPPPVKRPRNPLTRTDLIICVALVALIAAVFGQVVSHEFTSFDDPNYVYEEPQVFQGLSWGGVKWAFTTFTMGHWHPLTWLSLMANASMFGMNGGAFAAFNVLLHMVATVFLYLAVRELTGSRWASAFVAALGAIHPAHVESVAWVAARKDVVSGAFGFAALFVWARWVHKRTAGLYALFLLLFALSLLGKATFIVLPALLLLLDVWPLDRWSRRDAGRLLLEKVPVFILAFPVSLLAGTAQRVAGAMTSTDLLPLSIRIQNAIVSYLRYLGKLLWPENLSFFYPYQFFVDTTTVAICLAVLLIVSAAALFSIRRYPWFFTGWFWFVIAFSPVIGLFQSGMQLIADRYTYLPFTGPFLVLAWGAHHAAQRMRIPPRAMAVAAGVLIAILSVKSFFQTSLWRDSYTLYTHGIEVVPNNGFAHFKLALLLRDRGDHAGKRAHLRQALEGHKVTNRVPVGSRFLRTHYQAWYIDSELVLGADLVEETKRLTALGDHAGAAAALKEATAVLEEATSIRTEAAEVKALLAAAYSLAGRTADAERLYQNAVVSGEETYDSHLNLGAVLSRQGKTAEALEQFRAAARLQPQSIEPLIYLGLGLVQAGDRDGAIEQLTLAKQKDPAESNRFLTNALRLPPKPTNLDEFIAFLRGQSAAPKPVE